MASRCPVHAFIDFFFIPRRAPIVHQALGIGGDQTDQPGPSRTLQTPPRVTPCEGRVKDRVPRGPWLSLGVSRVLLQGC